MLGVYFIRIAKLPLTVNKLLLVLLACSFIEL